PLRLSDPSTPLFRSPDPRCGETLDGRAPAQPSMARKVGQAALTVPRLATQVALWPVVKTEDAAENYHLRDWMQAILTTDDGKVRSEEHTSELQSRVD